jgi:hypothetical protein
MNKHFSSKATKAILMMFALILVILIDIGFFQLYLDKVFGLLEVGVICLAIDFVIAFGFAFISKKIAVG